MKFQRKRNAIRNIKFGFLNKIITLIFPFILRTVIIYTLGAEYLGLSSLFSSILQVLSLSELGIGSAMVFSLYKPIALNDKKKIQQLVALYDYVYRVIGSIILILGVLVAPFLPFFISGSVPNDINLYVLYFLYLLNSSASYFISAYKSTILSAYQRRDVISNIGIISHIALYCVQLICLYNFKSYYMYVIWLPVFTIFENMLTAWYVKRNYKDYIRKVDYTNYDLKKLFQSVKSLFGHKLSQVVTNSVDSIIISTFLGLKMVAVYNNYYYCMSALSGILDIIYQAILAGIGNSLYSEDENKNRDDFLKFTVMNTWIVGWCSVCLLCLYQDVMDLWVGNDLMLSFDTIVLLSIYFYVWKIRQNILVYKDASGLWAADKWKPYVEIIVNLTINIVLVNVIGINGVVISTIISMLLISIPWETKVFFTTYFNNCFKKYILLEIKYAIFFVVAGFTTYMCCFVLDLVNMNLIVIKMITCLIVPNVIIYLGGYRSDVQRKTVVYLLSVVRR